MSGPGHKPGHPGTALDWASYLDELAGERGGLAQVAAELAAGRSFRDDVESISRALRRLRGRGSAAGGKWGERLLSTFGLPRAVDDRLRFMGSYHSRFVDLPVPLCADLVQLWDRPPTNESRSGRGWLSLARATLAMRRNQSSEIAVHLEAAASCLAGIARGNGDSQHLLAIEVALARAHFATRDDRTRVAPELATAEQLLAALPTTEDAYCLRARWAGQRAHALNSGGEFARGLALHEALADGNDVPPFARSRRANGLAYARLQLGDRVAALDHARMAATFAGDAGHVRLRAMALLMVVRIAGPTAEGIEAHHRAGAIARALADDTLTTRWQAAARDVAQRVHR